VPKMAGHSKPNVTLGRHMQAIRGEAEAVGSLERTFRSML
jgi:hypothetical protein